MKQQAPIAQCDRFRQCDADALMIVERFLDLVGIDALYALQLFFSRRRLVKIFNHGKQCIAYRLDCFAFLDHRARDMQAWGMTIDAKCKYLCSLASLDQLLVQTAIRCIAKDFRREVE